MANMNIPHIKCDTGQTFVERVFLKGLAIFSYTQLENLAQFYSVNPYIIYMLFTYAWGGTVASQFADHASKHTTHSIQRRTPEDMMILVFIAVQAAVQLRVTNAAGIKARCVRAAPALHARRLCAAHARGVKRV